MTKAAELIVPALELVGVLGAGETVATADQTTCLRTLNNLLDSWNTERLSIFTVQDHVKTGFTGGSVTIGPTGQINITRPTKLEETCFVRFGGVDYPLRQIDGETYSGLVLKSIPSVLPSVIYYDAQAPIATAYIWPQAAQSLDLHIRTQQQLEDFADWNTTDYDLPQGYRRALVYSLAEELFSVFARTIDQNVVRMASKSRRNLKRLNGTGAVLRMPGALTSRTGGRFNIYTGERG